MSAANTRARRLASAFITGLCTLVAVGGVQAQATVTRSVAYTYDPSTGQVLSEEVDPGGAHCVRTEHQLDEFGNKRVSVVKPCASTTASFAPRWIEHEFAASSTPGLQHPAGAYETAQRTGSGTMPAAASTLRESRTAWHPGAGQPVSQTEVAVGRTDSTRNLSKRTVHDGFGRVLDEYLPVQRNADGSVIETRTHYSYAYCAIDGSSPAPCMNLSASVWLDLASKRLVDPVTGAATTTARMAFRTAYYVEATPYDAAGNVIGARTRVHYDSLHREFAKESETYDGRWSRTLTGYDQLGLETASWGPHFGRDSGVALNPPGEVMQWTLARDLLHRPKETRRYWRDAAGGVAKLHRTLFAYNGTDSSATVTADSTPEAAERKVTTRRNAAGQVAQVIDTDGATLNKAYDPVGQLVKTVDALGNATTIGYTAGTARFKESMNDPDQGLWTYQHSALGELVRQQSPLQRAAVPASATVLAYDVLGRMTSRTSNTFTSTWSYDRYADGSLCAFGLARLCEERGGKVGAAPTTRVLRYDSLGRAWRSETGLDRLYASETSFDALGRVATLKYPTGFTVKYGYSAAGARVPGVVEKVVDAANAARVFWTVNDAAIDPRQVFDARGNLQAARLGNGVSVKQGFDPISGKAFSLQAGTGGLNNVMDLAYQYDVAGNVSRRQSNLRGLVETFSHDPLDRLTRYAVTSTSDPAANRTVDLAYNAIGNILRKSDFGNYAYGSRPHAVATAAGTSFSYDADGNLASTGGAVTRSNTWTEFDQPASLGQGANRVDFTYDAGFKRVKEVTTAGSTVRTLYLMHPDNQGGLGFEREETRVGGTLTRNESRHYVSVGGSTVVVKTLNDAGVVSSDPNLTQYWHRDALGSVVAVSNANATQPNGSAGPAELMAFDPWGRRLRDTGKVDTAVDPANGNRGFTGHEHLDEVGLVHMNGRVYDPLLGRFVSADSVVDGSNDLQAYNRYSYVFNNPMRFNDPSGHCPVCWAVVVFVAGAAMAHNGNEYWSVVGTMLMFYAAPKLVDAGLGAQVAQGASPNTFNVGGYGNAFLSGSGSMLVATNGDVDAALKAGAFAMAFNFAGGLSTAGERMVAHALIGCVQGAAGGGKCGPSAAAALVGKSVTEGLPESVSEVARGVATTIAGGTAAVIGGGKFANGAFQAGFGYVFNHLATAAEHRAMYAKGTEGRGHHWVGGGSLDTLDVSAEARAVFGQSVSGEKLPSSVHLRDHPAYTVAVRDELVSYGRTHDIDLARMTTDQAKSFVEHVKASSHPDIARIVGRINTYHAMPSTSRTLYRALSGVGAAGLAESFYPSPMRAPQCSINPDTPGC